ncbi:MAG: hypothetical protein SFU27_02315 [Thermonemataceae bacterium]|nr:hypothetical protein [Thermonemataceae bacterium]
MTKNQGILLRLEHLEVQLIKLVEKVKTLQSELTATNEENIALKEIIKKQNVQINNYENQYKISKIVSSIAPDNPEDAAELREKIDNYIADIDKCIHFLSK